jgi:ferrous iron transport protein B
MREEMNSAKWSWFTVAYQIGFAYAISLIVFQFGNVFVLHQAPTIWTAAAGLVLALILYMMFRKPKEVKEDVKEAVAVNNK